MKVDNYIKNLSTHFYCLILILTMLFGRTFQGLYISEYRVGEYLVFICLIFTVFYYPNKLFQKLKINFQYDKKTFIVSKLIFLNFIFIVLLTRGSFTNLYTYKSSSIIWTTAFLFIGSYIISEEKISKKYFNFIPYILFIVYILSTVHFPEFLISFFQNYSDKFDFIKGSDTLLVYVVCILVARNKFNKTTAGYAYFIVSSGLYIPLMLYKSKGAFFPGILFFLFSSLYFFDYFKKEKLKTFLISFIFIPIFLFSTFNSYGNFTFKKIGQDNYFQDETFSGNTIQRSLNVVVNEKNTTTIFASFFIINGRLYSQEQMANWRLQIWQDVARDIFWYADYSMDEQYKLIRAQGEFRTDKFLTGFGFNEMLPAMDYWERNGQDGTNENPHNYFVYVFGRGAVPLLALVLLFNVYIILNWKRKYDNYLILLFLLPIYFTISFDAAMESVRFPLIFYTFISYFQKNGILK